jgi:[ribosomal protein S18]-alanine N-acetyltransferase
MPPEATRSEGERVSLLWARPEHAAQIAQLHGALFPEGWDTATIEGLLAHPGSIALVATGNGGPADLCGFALAQVAADEAEILTIGVRPESQRRGVAEKLVAGLLRAGKNAGGQQMHLEVAESNVAALALYRKCGFSEAGRRKGYYARPGGAEDALRLIRQV